MHQLEGCPRIGQTVQGAELEAEVLLPTTVTLPETEDTQADYLLVPHMGQHPLSYDGLRSGEELVGVTPTAVGVEEGQVGVWGPESVHQLQLAPHQVEGMVRHQCFLDGVL